MARQKEAKISSDILAGLRAEGAFCFKVWGNEHMMTGLPDIIGCYKGHFFGFETKRPETRNDTSPRQERVRDLIRAAGGFCDVVCSKPEALLKLREAFP